MGQKVTQCPSFPHTYRTLRNCCTHIHIQKDQAVEVWNKSSHKMRWKCSLQQRAGHVFDEISYIHFMMDVWSICCVMKWASPFAPPPLHPGLLLKRAVGVNTPAAAVTIIVSSLPWRSQKDDFGWLMGESRGRNKSIADAALDTLSGERWIFTLTFKLR